MEGVFSGEIYKGVRKQYRDEAEIIQVKLNLNLIPLIPHIACNLDLLCLKAKEQGFINPSHQVPTRHCYMHKRRGMIFRLLLGTPAIHKQYSGEGCYREPLATAHTTAGGSNHTGKMEPRESREDMITIC
jgi:hypothetical protein